jgi:predicted SnoaL-like aldol condensation-catalyzing enzyme
MSTTEATMAAIERFNDAFNQHDVDGLTKLMTDDVVFEKTGDQRFEGQEAVCGFFRRFFETTPMAWFDTEDTFAVGDRCVVRWTLSFNKQEPERGRVRGVDVFRVGNGRVAEKFSYVKSAEVVRKLGLQPGGS